MSVLHFAPVRASAMVKDTNQALGKAREFRDAALADGWDISPIYDTESQDDAAELTRDGWKMFVFARADFAEVDIWGPDGLAIHFPPDLTLVDEFPPEWSEYSMGKLEKYLCYCEYCNSHNIETSRIGFAGRCCAKCLPAQKVKQEYPGWCD